MCMMLKMKNLIRGIASPSPFVKSRKGHKRKRKTYTCKNTPSLKVNFRKYRKIEEKETILVNTLKCETFTYENVIYNLFLFYIALHFHLRTLIQLLRTITTSNTSFSFFYAPSLSLMAEKKKHNKPSSLYF